MKLSLLLKMIAGLAIVTSALFAQPRIDQVQNNYSYLLPGNPNYGIAEGSIFIIKGSNLANGSTDLQNPPLQTALNGVSANVTVSGTTTKVLLYYITPGQLGGILPSSTPVGTGTITVTNNGQTSAAAPITVVRSAFGTLTINGTGSGLAAVFDASNKLLALNNSAKPNDTLVFYGSGLGPVQGDESVQQTQADLTNVPITVEIGGLQATVLYHGRTIYPGLDQINVQVPAGVTPSCDVTVLVKTGTIQSNQTTIPVAANGGNCPTPSSGTGTTISQSDISQWAAAGQFRGGYINLDRTTTYTGATAKTEDTLNGTFTKISGADLQKVFALQGSLPFFQQTIGACTVTTVTSAATNPFAGLNLNIAYLDAGSAITTSGPAGSKSAPKQTTVVPGLGQLISYSATIGNGTPGNYLDPGTYTISNTGGGDVGTFSGQLKVSTDFQWTNRASITTVDRTQGLNVTWTGGDPSTNTTISGGSSSINLSTGSFSSSSFSCIAKTSAGSFTVPADVLGKLPATTSLPTGGVSVPGVGGSLSVGTAGPGVRMVATGVDYLVANYDITISQAGVTFK